MCDCFPLVLFQESVLIAAQPFMRPMTEAVDRRREQKHIFEKVQGRGDQPSEDSDWPRVVVPSHPRTKDGSADHNAPSLMAENMNIPPPVIFSDVAGIFLDQFPIASDPFDVKNHVTELNFRQAF